MVAWVQKILSSLGLSQCFGCIQKAFFFFFFLNFQKAFSSSRSQTCKSQVRGTYHELNIFAMARMYMNLCDLLAAVT